MGKHFTHVRKKTRLAAVTVSAMLGLGVGIITVAAFVLTMRLLGKPISYLYYLAGVLAMLVSAVASYFVLMPSDKRLAKRLDEEHKLNEKMRTMIEFKDSDGAFNKLQREDADEKLGKVKYTPWRKKQLISALLVLVISAASLTTAFVIPGKADHVDPEDPLSKFEKDWILTELADLINTVDKALIEDGLKSKTLVDLRSLVTFVEEHEYLTEMKLEAIKVVININSNLNDVNSAPAIGEKLALCSDPILKEFGAELSKLNGPSAQKKLDELKSVLASVPRDDVSFTSDEIGSAITASGVMTANKLAELLTNLASAIRGYSNESVATLDEAFDKVGANVSSNIMLQTINKMIIQTVTSKLCSLFGIVQSDLENAGADSDIDIAPPSAPPAEEDDPIEDDKDQTIGAGSVGTGDRIYGSNDVIYNPYTNEYVPYGQVFDEYNAKVLQMVEDGRIPLEFEEFTAEYFRSLSDYKPEE